MPDPTPISELPSDATLALDDVIIVNHDNGDGTYTTERATLTEVQTLIGGGGGGGVPSVNGITAAVTIISPDSSVGVEVVGDEIQLTTSGGGGGGGNLPSSYDAMIQAEPGLIYYWPFSDASGGFLDLVLDRGWTVNGSPTYHATSLLSNGDPAAAFPDDTAYLTFDANIVTRNGEPWTLEFFFEIGSTPAAAIDLWNQENGSEGFALLINTSNEVFLDITDIGDYTLFTATPGTPYHFALVYDGLSLYWWMNGTLHYLGSFGYTFTATASSATIKGGPLTMQKLALYSLALSKNRLQAHYEAIAGTTLSWPFPASAPVLPSYDSVIIGQGASHYWPMNDAPGSTVAADAIGGQDLTGGSTVAFGFPALALDGETSCFSSGSGSELSMPAACQPTDTFSISFIMAMSPPSGSQLWVFGADSGNFGVGVHSTSEVTAYAILNKLVAWYDSATANGGGKTHICVTWDGSVFYLYVNGSAAINADGFFTPVPSTAAGTLLGSPGRMAKAAIWIGTVLTVQQVMAQVAAAGL